MIKIVNYQKSWPIEFALIAKDLQAVLQDPELAIDHIGSTSVVGLAAKDIIDIQITVPDITNTCIIDTLTASGYQFRDDITHDNLVGLSSNSKELKKWYFREREGMRTTHIHIREKDRTNQLYPLLFRDFLRSNARSRAAYATIKYELAARFSHDSESYYAIKDPYMDTIYEAAKLWSAQND